MITVIIDGQESPLNQLDEKTIHSRIREKQEAGLDVCVRVVINTDDANLAFATAGCGGGRGGGVKQFSPKEEELVRFWQQMKLSQPPLNSGNLIVFLKKFQYL